MNTLSFWPASHIRQTVLFQVKYNRKPTSKVQLKLPTTPTPMAYIAEPPNLEHEMHKMQHVLLYVLGGTNS